MSRTCRVCSLETQEAVIICGGDLNISSCKGYFHPKCLKLSKPCVKSVSHSKNIVWFCNSCVNDSSNDGLVLSEKLPHVISEMKSDLNRLLSDLKREILAEIDLRFSALHTNSDVPGHSLSKTATYTKQPDEIAVCTYAPEPSTDQHTNTTNTTTSTSATTRTCCCPHALTPTTSTHRMDNRTHNHDRVTTHASSPIARNSLLTGAATDSSTLFEGFIPSYEPRTWMFVTHVSPRISEEEIKSFIMDRLETSDCVVKKILPRDRHPSTLRFVSFKVSLPGSLRNSALSPSTWPRGFDFAEFEFRNRRSDAFFTLDTPYHTPV